MNACVEQNYVHMLEILHFVSLKFSFQLHLQLNSSLFSHFLETQQNIQSWGLFANFPKELSDKQFNGVILCLMKEIKQIHKLFLKKLTAFMSYCRRATETGKISKGFRDSNQIEQKTHFTKKKKGFIS